MAKVVYSTSFSWGKVRGVLLGVFAVFAFVTTASNVFNATTYQDTEVPPPSVTSQKTLPQSQLAPPKISSDETLLYQVAADVQTDGSVRFTETIVENFVSPAQGILRERLLVEEIDGRLRKFPVRDVRVNVSPGANERTDVSVFLDELTIRVGERHKRIFGVHTYELSYTVDGMVDVSDSGDPYMKFDLIANRTYPVRRFEGVVTLPTEPSTVGCLVELSGETYDCGGEVEGNRFSMSAANILAGDQLGVQIGFPAGSLPDLKPPLWVKGDSLTEALTWGALTLLFIFVGVLAAQRQQKKSWVPTTATLSETFAVHYGNDTPTDTPADDALGDALETGQLLVGDEPLVEFTPPQKLRPAHMGVLLDIMSSRELFVSTLVDLTARNWVDFQQDGGLWTIKWKGDGTTPLRPFEERLLGMLLEGKTSVTSKEVAERTRNTLPEILSSTQRGVFDETRQLGLVGKMRFNRNALVMFAAGVGASCVPHFFLAEMSDAPRLPFIILALAALVSLVFTTKKTPLGVAMRWRILGFKRLFTESENHYTQLAASQNIMRQYMGYAVEFGEIDKWLNTFPDAQKDPTMTVVPIGAAAFVASVNSFTPRSPSHPPSSSGRFPVESSPDDAP